MFGGLGFSVWSFRPQGSGCRVSSCGVGFGWGASVGFSFRLGRRTAACSDCVSD